MKRQTFSTTMWAICGLSICASVMTGCEDSGTTHASSSSEKTQWITQSLEHDQSSHDDFSDHDDEHPSFCEDQDQIDEEEDHEIDEDEEGEGEEDENDENEEGDSEEDDNENDEGEGDDSENDEGEDDDGENDEGEEDSSDDDEVEDGEGEEDDSEDDEAEDIDSEDDENEGDASPDRPEAEQPPVPVTSGIPTLEWRYGYGEDETEEHPHHGIQTQNGGFAVVGERYIGENARIFVVVTDSAGHQLFTKDLGENRWNNGNQILEEPDGNFLVGGSWDTGSGGVQEHERVIIRLSPQGEELARRIYPAQGRDAIRGISLSDDGSIIAVGYKGAAYDDETFIIGSGNSFVMKLSAQLDLIWDRDLENPYELKRILPNHNSSGYVGFGACRNEQSETNLCLAFMNLNGEVTQTRIYGDGHGYDFDRTPDGGFIMGGHKVVNQGWDGWAVRVNAQGDELWSSTFGQPNGGTSTQMFEECYGVKSVPWGGYVLGCGSGVEPDNIADHNDPLNVWRAYVVRLDELGNLSWHHTYSNGEGDDAAEYIVPTADQGFAVFTDSSELGGQLGIYKLSPEQ